MKKPLFLLMAAALVVIGLSLSTTAEERVSHYEAAKIETVKQAQETLDATNIEISEILKSDSLTEAQLEKIHEISYTLENAIDFMIANKAAPKDKMSAVDDAVQAIHHHSEDHEEAAVREWFPKLKTTVTNLKN